MTSIEQIGEEAEARGTDVRVTVAATLGNEAFQTFGDVARMLRGIADKLEADGTSGYFETILDDNGNDVGRWKVGPDR